MRNLHRAIAEFDLVQVYDNPSPAHPNQRQSETAPLVLEAHGGAIVSCGDAPPGWLRTALQDTKCAL
ncbi:MAG: hypothetical protein K8T20_04295 [Planctomycetes bacterium]|nr:hypothetical protein [Planctomycetota bacterium]